MSYTFKKTLKEGVLTYDGSSKFYSLKGNDGQVGFIEEDSIKDATAFYNKIMLSNSVSQIGKLYNGEIAQHIQKALNDDGLEQYLLAMDYKAGTEMRRLEYLYNYWIKKAVSNNNSDAKNYLA